MTRLRHISQSLLRWRKTMDLVEYSLLAVFMALALVAFTEDVVWEGQGDIRSQDARPWEIHEGEIRLARIELAELPPVVSRG